jgi:outer membrane protein assembly factor BamB
VFKSKKLSRNKTKNRTLYENKNVLLSDDKGNITVYSTKSQKIIFKYNFYKKKYKKIKKDLNFIVENNIVYIGDNLGYLYALDYIDKKLLWAQDYKVPFRSNIKISGKKLLITDINNSLYFVNKVNGEKLKIIPTEETLIKNEFINSLVSNNDSIFLLNTFGSVYSVNNNGQVRWFSNLNQSMDINSSNLFSSKPLVLHQNKLFISTNLYLYILDINTGATLFKIAVSSLISPIISGDNLFLISKDNLLMCLDVKTNEVLYSVDINQSLADFLDTKKKSISIKSLTIANNDLLLFLNNSYLVSFNSTGKVKNTVKLPSKPYSLPMFVNDLIIYLDNKNKLIIVN